MLGELLAATPATLLSETSEHKISLDIIVLTGLWIVRMEELFILREVDYNSNALKEKAKGRNL